MLFVSGASSSGVKNGYANAVFIYSKGLNDEIGQVNRIVSSRSTAINGGSGNAELDMEFDLSSPSNLQLKHVTALVTSNIVTYNIRFVQM